MAFGSLSLSELSTQAQIQSISAMSAALLIYHGESREIQMQQYQIAVLIAEDEIRQRGFEVISRNDRFIDRPAAERPGDRPDDHVWWLIVARKP